MLGIERCLLNVFLRHGGSDPITPYFVVVGDKVLTAIDSLKL